MNMELGTYITSESQDGGESKDRLHDGLKKWSLELIKCPKVVKILSAKKQVAD